VIKAEDFAHGIFVRYIETDLEEAGARTLNREVYFAQGVSEFNIKDYKTFQKSLLYVVPPFRSQPVSLVRRSFS